MKKIRFAFALLGALVFTLPSQAMTYPDTKVWVVKDNAKPYLKPYSQLRLETQTIKWMIATNQKIDTEHLGNYYLVRVVIKRGKVDKMVFMNNYGDMRIYRLQNGRHINQCAILLSANDGLGWCDG